MADLVACTVDPGGNGDYVSLNAAEAANFGATGADLVSNDEYVVCTCICTNGKADTTAVTINGQTCDATRNITITVGAAYRHAGVFPQSGNIYRLDCTGNSNGLYVNAVDYVEVSWLALHYNPSVADRQGVAVLNVDGFSLQNSLVFLSGERGGNCRTISFSGCDQTLTVANCVLWGSLEWTLHIYNSAGTAQLYQNTIYGVNAVVRHATNTVTVYVKNNLAFGSSNSFTGTFDASSTHNAYKTGSDPGSNGVNLSAVDADDLFVDYAGADFHLLAPTGIASSDHVLYGAGTDLSGEGVTDDIDGYTRVRWDIGADEITTNDGPVLRPCTVDTGGTGDYVSLNAAEAANFGASNADLTSVDEYVVCTCICTDGEADTTLTEMLGQTTSSTHSITIVVDVLYRHTGVFPASGSFKYRLDTGQHGLLIKTHFVHCNGLAVRTAPTANSSYAILVYEIDGCELSNCVSCCVNTSHNSYYGIQVFDSGSGYSATIKNCIVYGFTGTNHYGVRLKLTGVQYVYNCTVPYNTYGISQGTGTAVIKNNLAFANTDDYHGTFHADSTHNAYSQGSDPGSNGTDISGYTAAQLFQDPTNNNYLLKSRNPMGRVGTNLYTDATLPVTDDILGNARRIIGSDWCVGAHISDDSDPSILNTVDDDISWWALEELYAEGAYHP